MSDLNLHHARQALAALDHLVVQDLFLTETAFLADRITAYARVDAGLQRGEIFIPFCYHEAAANLLTNEALDPCGKIPEFKYCAVRISAA